MNMKTIVLKNPLARWMAFIAAFLALANPLTWAAGPKAPTIYAFNVAAEATIILGTTTSLNWSVSNDTTELTLTGVGNVTGQTSVAITPTATTNYVLTAKNAAGGVTTKSKLITVIAPPVIQAFEVFPTSIAAGQSAKLTWLAPGATWYYIEADTEYDPGQTFETTAVVKPKTTVTYKLTANNAAGSSSKTVTLPVSAPLPKPVITSFTASPVSVVQGDATTLNWVVNGATSVSISPGVGAVTGTSVSVRPTATTAYTLTATNSSGSVTKKFTVSVVPAAPVISAFTASPDSITVGQSTTLQWAVSGASSLSISPGLGAVSGTSITISPTANTTYTLSATGPGGTVTKNVSVAVAPVATPAPVIASFTASATTITQGNPVTLNWSVSGATSLSISPGVGAVSGTSLVLTPNATTNYILSATNESGTVTKNVTVTVLFPVPPPLITSFTTSSPSVVQGSPVTLSWAVTGATSLEISPGVGPVTGTSLTLTPGATTTYTLTATNEGGSVFKTVNVAVTEQIPAPVIASFTASPDTIASGNATLAWSVTGATQISIAANVGANPGIVTGASFVVSPATTTVYTLSATNVTGTITRTATVTVQAPAPTISIDSLTASTLVANAGDPVTISWAVTNADSLWLSATFGGDIGNVTGKTSVVVHPLGTTRYALTAFSSQYGTVGKAVTVTVGPAPVPVIDSFAANPSTIPIEASTTLNWSVSDATRITITANHGTSPGEVTGNSLVVSPVETTAYTLHAFNNFGEATRQATVTVTGPVAPVIGSFAANPAFISAGESSTLTWAVSGANSLSITADSGPNPGTVSGNSLLVTPTQTTTYTLKAVNTIGETTALTAVTIFTPGNGSVTHPRIWVTPAQVPVLAQRAATNDPAWLKLRAACDEWATRRVAFPDEAPSGGTINGGYQYIDYLLPSQNSRSATWSRRRSIPCAPRATSPRRRSCCSRSPIRSATAVRRPTPATASAPTCRRSRSATTGSTRR
jgi:hypothetical protein